MSYRKVCEFDVAVRAGKRTFRVLEDEGPDGTFRVIEEKLVDRLGEPCWLAAYLTDPFVADLCEGAYHQGVYDNE